MKNDLKELKISAGTTHTLAYSDDNFYAWGDITSFSFGFLQFSLINK